MEWNIRQCENLDKADFLRAGRYGIPQMAPVKLEEPVSMIGFNFAKRAAHPETLGVHFFLKDYQFTRLWDHPEMYTDMLGRFLFVCTPDFSMYTDYPPAVQIYNHYRKHWLGVYWQQQGMTVIPTVSWSDEQSYEWCFDGDPIGGTVAVSSVGTQMNAETKRLFLQGFDEMIRRIRPETVLFHGDIPEEIRAKYCSEDAEIHIVPIEAYQARLRNIKKGEP